MQFTSSIKGKRNEVNHLIHSSLLNVFQCFGYNYRFLVHSDNHRDFCTCEMAILFRVQWNGTLPSFLDPCLVQQKTARFWNVLQLLTCACTARNLSRQPIAVSDISIYICLIDIRDGSSKPVYGGVDRLMIGTYSYAYLWYTMWFHTLRMHKKTHLLKVDDFTM